MKKVIVTGANGFVGTWLVNELVNNGVEVFAIVKDKNEDVSRIMNLKSCHIIYCDLKEIHKLSNIIEYEVDTFYHLAWIGSTGTERSNYETQLMNVKYACDAAVTAKKICCKRFLCAGTITEKIAQNILNIDSKADNIIYGLEKHNTHCILDVLCKKIGIEYVWMQFSNIYGPYNNSGNIISYMLKEFLNGRRPLFGSGEQPYDFIYIKDLVRAAFLLGEKAINKNCYFIGSGSHKKLKDYLIDITSIYGNNAQIGLGERPNDGLKYEEKWFDISDLRKDTGFEPAYDFKAAIEETVLWLKEQEDGTKV